jgi:pyruvate dehydrogenase E1 component
LGSGSIIWEVLRAQNILKEKFGIAADVWSVTSYSELRREALACERWNRLHPGEAPKAPWILRQLDSKGLPVVATSDWVKAVPDQIARWFPDFLSLGTDGLGRSESRKALRRFFEVDAESVVIAALSQLLKRGVVDVAVVRKAIEEFGFPAEKPDPALV